MLLCDLQTLLASAYRLPIDINIADYLTTDRQVPRSILGESARIADEVLLVHEDASTLDVALFIDNGVLGRLAFADPREVLSDSNLDDFCQVLEGVSHFVYLIWNAAKDRSVTRLEMEVQAEIDKYLSARMLLEVQGDQRLQGADLLRRLFDGVRYHEDLHTDEIERYRYANDVACRYCNHLEQRFAGRNVSAGLKEELRAFYRMPQPDKLSHMNVAQFS